MADAEPWTCRKRAGTLGKHKDSSAHRRVPGGRCRGQSGALRPAAAGGERPGPKARACIRGQFDGAGTMYRVSLESCL